MSIIGNGALKPGINSHVLILYVVNVVGVMMHTKKALQENYPHDKFSQINSLTENRMAKKGGRAKITLEAMRTLFKEELASTKAEITVYMDDKFKEVHKKFLEHEQYFTLIQADLIEIKTDVATLKTDVAVLKADVAVLKTDVATLKTDLKEFRGETKSFQSGFVLNEYGGYGGPRTIQTE